MAPDTSVARRRSRAVDLLQGDGRASARRKRAGGGSRQVPGSAVWFLLVMRWRAWSAHGFRGTKIRYEGEGHSFSARVYGLFIYNYEVALLAELVPITIVGISIPFLCLDSLHVGLLSHAFRLKSFAKRAERNLMWVQRAQASTQVMEVFIAIIFQACIVHIGICA